MILLAFQKGGWNVGSSREEEKWYKKQHSILFFVASNQRQALISVVCDHYCNILEIVDLESGKDTVYFLDQKEVVHHSFQKWAGQDDKIIVNDHLHIVELMVMECSWDRTTIF